MITARISEDERDEGMKFTVDYWLRDCLLSCKRFWVLLPKLGRDIHGFDDGALMCKRVLVDWLVTAALLSFEMLPWS